MREPGRKPASVVSDLRPPHRRGRPKAEEQADGEGGYAVEEEE